MQNNTHTYTLNQTNFTNDIDLSAHWVIYVLQVLSKLCRKAMWIGNDMILGEKQSKSILNTIFCHLVFERQLCNKGDILSSLPPLY